MADTNFISKLTVIASTWANDVNKAIYRAIGTGTNGTAPQTPADVRTNLGLPSTSGASYIGLTSTLGVTTLQGYTDFIVSNNGATGVGHLATAHVAAGPLQTWLTTVDSGVGWLASVNTWTAEQDLLYSIPTASAGVDHAGWSAVIHNPANSTSTDNIVALRGIGYYDSTLVNSSNGVWGIATEAWSNATNYVTLIGGEFSIISQCPTQAVPLVGVNSVFKNRADNQTGPTAPVGAGSLYNFDSFAFFVSSQIRPTDGIHTNVGSGWQAAFRIGDPINGSGLDWEGGSQYPGSSVYKAYTTVNDMTGSLKDMAGGFPWFVLYKNSATYWGMRFNGTLTGALKSYNILVHAGGGGAGYAPGDIGNITGGGGAGAQYQVATVVAGAVTKVYVYGFGGSGYTTTSAAATTATTGAGAGLTLDIDIGKGLIWGGDLGIANGGAGYAIGNLVYLNGGVAGYAQPIIKVTNVAAGVVTGIELQTAESNLQLATTPDSNTLGRGFTAGNQTTTAIGGGGAGLQINIARTHDDTCIGGEKWEFWRMANPSNPSSSGGRHGFIDSSFPGTPLTIPAVPFTLPVDRPL